MVTIAPMEALPVAAGFLVISGVAGVLSHDRPHLFVNVRGVVGGRTFPGGLGRAVVTHRTSLRGSSATTPDLGPARPGASSNHR